jgi:hypothetical protein
MYIEKDFRECLLIVNVLLTTYSINGKLKILLQYIVK